MGLPVKAITLAEAITLTRASTAWYFDSAGVFQQAATNVIREDHDPGDSNARQGIAVEGASTNLFKYSEDLSNAVWTKSSTTIGTATSFATNISLDEIIPNTSSTTHFVIETVAVPGTVATFSVIAKAGAYSGLELWLGTTSDPRVQAKFDLSAGTVGSVVTTDSGATGVSDQDAKIVPLGGGFYRCSLTARLPSLTSYSASAFITETGASSIVFAGDGTSSLFAGAAQLEQLAFASSYIPTVASQVTRAAEVLLITDLDPWYRASGCAFELEYKVRGLQLTQVILQLNDGTNANLVGLTAVASAAAPRPQAFVVNGGVDQAVPVAGLGPAAYARGRAAVRVRENDVAISANGSAAVTDTSATLPPPATQARVGSRVASPHFPTYGWLRDFKYVTDPVLIASDYDNAGLALRSAEYA